MISDRALIVVDMQNDFARPDGALYVPGGEEIIQRIYHQIDVFRNFGWPVFFTQDWHPESTPHFAKDGGLWPVHCVAETAGAEIVSELADQANEFGWIIKKGQGQNDGYSGFSDNNLSDDELEQTGLKTILQSVGIKQLVVVGLAGDFCVKATAIDGVKEGFEVCVPIKYTRFVELNDGDSKKAIAEMREAGVFVW